MTARLRIRAVASLDSGATKLSWSSSVGLNPSSTSKILRTCGDHMVSFVWRSNSQPPIPDRRETCSFICSYRRRSSSTFRWAVTSSSVPITRAVRPSACSGCPMLRRRMARPFSDTASNSMSNDRPSRTASRTAVLTWACASGGSKLATASGVGSKASSASKTRRISSVHSVRPVPRSISQPPTPVSLEMSPSNRSVRPSVRSSSRCRVTSCIVPTRRVTRPSLCSTLQTLRTRMGRPLAVMASYSQSDGTPKLAACRIELSCISRDPGAKNALNDSGVGSNASATSKMCRVSFDHCTRLFAAS